MRRLQGRSLEWTILVPATVAIVAAVVFTGSPLSMLLAAVDEAHTPADTGSSPL